MIEQLIFMIMILIIFFGLVPTFIYFCVKATIIAFYSAKNIMKNKNNNFRKKE